MISKVEAYHIQSPGWSSGMIRPSGVPILVTRVLMGEAPVRIRVRALPFLSFIFALRELHSLLLREKYIYIELCIIFLLSSLVPVSGVSRDNYKPVWSCSDDLSLVALF